jgi:acetoacetyl-CoA synthetase
VLTAPQFEWVHRAFNDRLVISSCSGGTDICGACAYSNFSFHLSSSCDESVVVYSIPTLPVYAGEIQGKVLGMAVGIFDDAGRDISESGRAGELVCTRPHPSVPTRFWGDDSRGTLFLKAYYDFYPGVWRHGDFIAMNPRTKGYIIFGRRFVVAPCLYSEARPVAYSDGVLNPSGVRFGSGEIYAVLERSEFAARIDDAICVGQRRPQDKDERVLLFIKMRAGHKLDQPFEQVIRAAIKEALSARHVPAHIFEVKDIPVSSSLPPAFRAYGTRGADWVFWTTVYDQWEED